MTWMDNQYLILWISSFIIFYIYIIWALIKGFASPHFSFKENQTTNVIDNIKKNEKIKEPNKPHALSPPLYKEISLHYNNNEGSNCAKRTQNPIKNIILAKLLKSIMSKKPKYNNKSPKNNPSFPRAFGNSFIHQNTNITETNYDSDKPSQLENGVHSKRIIRRLATKCKQYLPFPPFLSLSLTFDFSSPFLRHFPLPFSPFSYVYLYQ